MRIEKKWWRCGSCGNMPGQDCFLLCLGRPNFCPEGWDPDHGDKRAMWRQIDRPWQPTSDRVLELERRVEVLERRPTNLQVIDTLADVGDRVDKMLAKTIQLYNDAEAIGRGRLKG